MKYLLDTHAWLWIVGSPDRLGPEVKVLLADSDNAFFLSIASAWEIAIKHGNGRLALPDEPLAFVRSRAHADGIGLLTIQLEHVCAAAQLPRHHGDPFDRLLIAQARAEQLTLISHDGRVGAYDVAVVDPRV